MPGSPRPMSNQNDSEIELAPKPSKLRLVRRKRRHRSNRTSDSQSYQPQVDIEDGQEPQSFTILPPNPHFNTPEGSVWYQIFLNDKLINLFLLLVTSLYFFDCLMSWASINNLPFYSLHQQGDLIQEMQGSFYGPLQFMSANLNADPIIGIQIMDRGSQCPPGFEVFKLGDWPGTIPGCLYENGDLYATSCSNINSSKSNQDIPETSRMEMYEWDNSIWCVKRAILKGHYVKEINCPENFQECYPGGCFVGDCPITKMHIAPTGETANKFKNREDKYLVLTRTKGELPLINIQVTFGDIPCFTQELFAQNIKNSSYELSAIKENRCDRYGLNNQYSTIIDSKTAFDAFIQNSFPNYLMHLPYFQESAKSTQAILSSMTRIETARNTHCLSVRERDLGFIGMSWNRFNESIRMTWVFFLFCLFTYRIGHIFRFYLDPTYHNPPPEEPEGRPKPLRYIYWMSTVIFTIGLSVTFLGLNLNFNKLKEDFEAYESLKCFEGSQGSIVISDSLVVFKKIVGSFWIYWATFIATILSIFIVYYLLFYYKRRRQH